MEKTTTWSDGEGSGIEVELARVLRALEMRLPTEVAERVLLSADLDAVA